MIITVSGMPGSGKSTIAQRISEILGWERFYIGGLRREIAKSMGLTLDELNRIGETDISTDKIADDKILELASTKDNIIIEGRTAYYFVPKSIKLFFDVGLKEAAHRIFLQNRTNEHYETEEEELESLRSRIKSDERRYLKYYKIHCYDRSQFDIVVDTSHRTVQEVLRETIQGLERLGIKFPKGSVKG